MRSRFISREHRAVYRIVLLYALFSGIWIYSSDTILPWFVESPELITRISIYKGMLFILVTGALLYKLISRYFFRMAEVNRQLRESEQRFEQIFNSVTDAIFIHDAVTGRIVDVNQAMCSLYGVSREEALVLAPQEASLGSPPYSDAEAREWLRRAAEGAPQVFEWHARKKDGTLFWVEVSMRRATIGAEARIIAMVRDITERRLKDEALRQSEEMLQLQFARMPNACIVWDDHYRVRSWNPAAEKIFGYTAAEAVGRHANALIVPEAVQRQTDAIWTGLMAGDPIAISLNENVTRDGRTILCEWTNSPLSDRDGSLVGVISMVQDVTDRKEREQEQLKMQKLESLGLLAGGIAHDFNNILTAVLGNITLVRMKMLPNDPWYRQLEEAEAATYRAKDLTHQLLTFSRGGAPIKKVMDIEKLIRDTALFAVRGANVRCEFSFAPHLWPADIDEGQIAQVFSNLVINAGQAMPAGGVIRVRAGNEEVTQKNGLPLAEGRFVSVTVEDQGIGIPQENLAKIFDPYYTTKQKGSGLGLAITYSIIRNHGGHIAVRSVLGEGTAFTVYLPAADRMPSGGIGYADEHVTGQGRVLLMDDEEFVRSVTSQILQVMGYETVCAADGREAVRLFREALDAGRPFDAVVMDLTVPGGMGGKEAIQELRSLDPQVRAIVASGYSQDPIMADYTTYGFSGAIAKPFSSAKLSRILHEVLTGRGSA